MNIMKDNNFISKYWLHGLCVIIWTAAFVMLVCLYNQLKAAPEQKVSTATTLEESTIHYETIAEREMREEREYIENYLKKSISFCKRNYSEELANIILEKSKKYSVEPYVIYALIAAESGVSSHIMNEKNIMNVHDKAVSSAGCIGLTQVGKFALADYNNTHGTKYTLEDLYNIETNIEVGVWHFCRYRKYEETLTGLYVIYNVGYNEYSSVNPYWFYGWDGKWYSNYHNKFFYMNGLYPPTRKTNYQRGLYGKNRLPEYSPKDRFEMCLDICKKYFDAEN